MKRRPFWRPASSLDESQRLRRVAPMNESFNWGVFISSMCLGKTLLLARGSQLTVTVSSSSSESTSLTTHCNSCCVFENILKLHFTPTFVLLFLFFFQSFPSTKVVPKHSRGTFALSAHEGKWKEKKQKKTNFCLVYSTGGPCCGFIRVMCKISDISLIHLAKIQQKHFSVSLMFALISLVASKTKTVAR